MPYIIKPFFQNFEITEEMIIEFQEQRPITPNYLRTVEYLDRYENSPIILRSIVIPRIIAHTFRALEKIKKFDYNFEVKVFVEHCLAPSSFLLFSKLGIYPEFKINTKNKPREIREIKARADFWEKTFDLLVALDALGWLPKSLLGPLDISHIFEEMLVERIFLIPEFNSTKSKLFFTCISDWHRDLAFRNNKLKSGEVLYQGSFTVAVLKTGAKLSEKSQDFRKKIWLPLISANSTFLTCQFNPSRAKGRGRKASKRKIVVKGKAIN